MDKVCRVCWAVILSRCDHDIWRTDLKIQSVDGRGTAYIPSKFYKNSLKNKREIRVLHIFACCLFVTLTFNLRPWNLHQVVSLSRTINKINLKKIGWYMTEQLLNKNFHLVSTCDLDLWPSYSKMYTAVLQVIICSTSYHLSTGQIWEISDEKWQRNRRTQLVGKKKWIYMYFTSIACYCVTFTYKFKFGNNFWTACPIWKILSLSPIFWPHPTPGGMWCQWSVRNP